MKKILIITIFFSIFAHSDDELKKIGEKFLNNITSKVLNSFFSDNALGKVASMCYEVKNDTNFDLDNMCDFVNFQYSKSLDMCHYAPEIIGLTKKTKELSLGLDTSSLYKLCQNKAKIAIDNVVSKVSIWNAQASKKAKLPSGVSYEDYFKNKFDFEQLVDRTNESLVSHYYNSTSSKYDQQTAKYLLDIVLRKENIDLEDFAAIDIEKDIKAPENMPAYLEQVSQLTGAFTGDLKVASPNNLSSKLNGSITSYTDFQNQDIANKQASKEIGIVKKIIEQNARIKKGLLKDLNSSPDDLALPTQETLQLYKDSVKPKYAMLIKKQQQRDAYINSLIESEVQLKSDIVDLTAKKVVIMKARFPEEEVKASIDKLVENINE